MNFYIHPIHAATAKVMIQNSSNFPEGPFLLPHFEKHPHLPMTISLPGSPCGGEPQRLPTQCPSPGVVWVSFPAHSTLGRKPCPLGLTSGSVPPLTSPPGLQVLCLHFVLSLSHLFHLVGSPGRWCGRPVIPGHLQAVRVGPAVPCGSS